MNDETVTSIVHHQIKENKKDEFHLWLTKIRDECQKFDGYIDSKLVDSIGCEREVISIFRFKSHSLLNKWLKSKVHSELLAELAFITEKEVQIKSYSGLEYWFEDSASSKLTMMTVTFIGLLPLVLFVPPIIAKVTNLDGTILITFSTALIVVLMTYAVMPLLMKFKSYVGV